MNTERVCICGCPFIAHAMLQFKGNTPPVYYCREHVSKPGFWCTTYTPIGNLTYLERLSKKDEEQQAL